MTLANRILLAKVETVYAVDPPMVVHMIKPRPWLHLYGIAESDVRLHCAVCDVELRPRTRNGLATALKKHRHCGLTKRVIGSR